MIAGPCTVVRENGAKREGGVVRLRRRGGGGVMFCSLSVYVLSQFLWGMVTSDRWTCSQISTAGTSCSFKSTFNRVNAGELPAGSICSCCQTGFSAWMLEAPRKAYTGMFFGPACVFAAADGLQKPGS